MSNLGERRIISKYGFDISAGGTFCFRNTPTGYFLLLSYNPTKGLLTYDVGYGAGLQPISGTAIVSVDVIQQIVNNLEIHIKYTIKE